MTAIEIILGVGVLLAGGLAFLAHRDHLSLKDEVNKQITAGKADVTKVGADLKVLEAKVTGKTPPAA